MLRLPPCRIVALALAGVAPFVHAQSPGCPAIPADVQKANAAAHAFFQQRVIRPGATGAASRARPPGMESALLNGARGDGVADDTRALQAALAKGGGVWLESGRVFRITRRLTLGTGAALVSDGTATILMAAGNGAFDNVSARRADNAVYGERGTGLRIDGQRVTLTDFTLAREYADGRHVIGIDVVGASDVTMRRLRLRGFALGPGIVTIRSSDNVEVSSSLVQGCSRTRPPDDGGVAPLTAIAVDDERVGGRGSTGVTLRNNVIDVRLLAPAPRGNPSDGIRFAAPGAGKGSALVDNDVQGADEALDLTGTGLEVRGNRLAAAGRVLRLADGARNVTVTGNEFQPGPRAHAIAIARPGPAEAARQVKDIRIERNRFQLGAAAVAAVHVEEGGAFAPAAILLKQNQFLLGDNCRNPAPVHCGPAQCRQEGNDVSFARVHPKCKP